MGNTIAKTFKICYNVSVEMAHCYQTHRVRIILSLLVVLSFLVVGVSHGSAVVAPALSSKILRNQTDWNAVQLKQMVFVVAKETGVNPYTLSALCQCESTWRQFGSDGLVLRGQVVSHDLGLFQINETTWGAVAQQLGLDLKNPVDNALMAVWILQNDSRGIRNWSPSKACWHSVVANF